MELRVSVGCMLARLLLGHFISLVDGIDVGLHGLLLLITFELSQAIFNCSLIALIITMLRNLL